MKTKVFLRGENKFKEVKITDPDKPEISSEILSKWQNIINIIADIIGVSAGLIMKITPETMEVVLKSENEDNPYKVGGNDSLGHGLYCETVIGKNKELYIKNALDNNNWKDNPDIDLNMISYCGFPIKWPDGEIFGTICILDDNIMDLDKKSRKLLEEFRNVIEDDFNLLTKEQEFKNFFDVNLDLLCITDTDGNFIKVNNTWSDLLGYSKDNLEEMNFLDFVHSDDLESTIDEIDNLKSNQKTIEFINRYKDKNGKYHYIEWNSNIKGDYIYAAARDITDKIIQNERLKQQKDKLNFIIEGIDAATWQWNIQTDKTIFSDKWAEMLGYKSEELEPTTGETWRKLIHPDDLIRAEKKLDEHLSGKSDHYKIEVKMKHKDGHWVWVNVRGRLTSWTEDNKPLKMFGIHLDITEKKKKEEKLKESIELIEDLSNQAPGTLYQYQLFPDGSSRFPYASEGIYQIYEVTPEEIVKDAGKVFERIHPDDYDQVVNSIQKSADTLDIWHDEYRVILPNQGEKWVEGRAKPEKMEDGSVLWHGNIREITEEKKMQLKIKDQKDKLNWTIEGTDAGTWEWNIQTGKTFFNKKWAEMLGYKLEELEPTTIDTWEKYTHPEDLKKSEKNLKKHFRGETEQYDVEIRMKHKDGHWIWVNDRGKVISWTEDNRPYKMFGIHLDITERKRKEEKIKYLAESMKNVSDSVMITDTNFKIQYMNKAGENLFGYSFEEIEGKTPVIFNVEENASKIQQKIYKKVSNGNVYKTEFLNKRKDGTTFICEMKATPIKNEAGEIYAYIGIQRDITKRRKQQERLKYQHKFQKKLAKISSGLLKIRSSNIDRKINDALKIIGEFFEIDRSYIFIFSDNQKLMSNSHEWCSEDIEAQKDNLQNIPSDIFPWWMKQLSQNKMINIPDVSKMRKEAEAEQKILEDQDIKSIVVMPIVIENELFGFLGFDSVKTKRNFSSEEIRLLKIFTDTIINAFSKNIDDKRIRKLTYRDSLTGLYNRRFFEEEMERLDTERQLPISVIVADINGLKIINDSLGHKKGDQLLKKSTEILKTATRKEDILARQGGDEFAILLPKTGKEKAKKVIERIKEKSRQTNDDELTVTMALGVAVKNNHDQNIEYILQTADNNMYQNKLSESRNAKSRIINSLLKNLETKSNETKKHIERMEILAVDFGERLELSTSEINRLTLLAKLHDIGKTTIDENILKKPGSLTNKEWEIIKEHPEKGYQIASSSQKFAVVADDIFTHHERWDGSGYPQGLKEDEIPYLARIITIIDAYDVMTHDRPYSKAISKEEALAEIKGCADSQFDPELADKFIKMIND